MDNGVLLTYIIECALVFLSVVGGKTKNKYKYICTRNSNEIDKNTLMNMLNLHDILFRITSILYC